MWGDSHAAHYVAGLGRISLSRFERLASNRKLCPPSRFRRPAAAALSSVQCQDSYLIESRRPTAVVLSAQWRAYLLHAQDNMMSADEFFCSPSEPSSKGSVR